MWKCSCAAIAKFHKNERGLLQYVEAFDPTLVILEISSTKGKIKEWNFGCQNSDVLLQMDKCIEDPYFTYAMVNHQLQIQRRIGFEGQVGMGLLGGKVRVIKT